MNGIIDNDLLDNLPSHQPIRKKVKNVRKSKAHDQDIRVTLYRHNPTKIGVELFDGEPEWVAVADPNGKNAMRRDAFEEYNDGREYNYYDTYHGKQVVGRWEGERPKEIRPF